MRAPEKKPLVHQEKPENMHVAVHRAEPKKNIEPIKALSEFHDWVSQSQFWDLIYKQILMKIYS